ncbi:DUF397 domain-containing protein [Kitasatospora phosalacinea]|uniref:DUF397 domain-containing protein n=1 Tax=Kitasatospora phosalacinea TaxID=2065 RepID=UPI000526067A|nr:DUF397 domain-containing protein [Kitasatospora phosalacinea]
MTDPQWFKSSYSNNGGACVEIAVNIPGTVPVRDSKDPSGPRLEFTPASWTSFVDAAATGEFGEV